MLIASSQQYGSGRPIDAPFDYPITSRADLVGYQAPDPTLPGRTAEVEVAVGMDNGGIAILGGVSGPLTNTWLLMGYERICYALYDDPSLLTELFRISNEYNMEAARLSVAAGCQAIFISDDLGDSSRGFMRLPHFREYLPTAGCASTVASGIPTTASAGMRRAVMAQMSGLGCWPSTR